MADIIRKMTVEKGFDPRDFVLFAFGGAGPAHAGVFARELGVRKVIVPQRKAASTWCAFGAAAADVLHIFEHIEIQGSPFAGGAGERGAGGPQAQAEAQMAKDGIAASRRKFEFSLDMRHQRQINEVEVLLPEAAARGRLRAARCGSVSYDRYEQLYGRGSALPRRAARDRDDARPGDGGHAAAEAHESAQPHRRDPEGGQARDAADLLGGAEAHAQDAGLRRRGPRRATASRARRSSRRRETNVVVPPGARLRVDALGNFEILFK